MPPMAPDLYRSSRTKTEAVLTEALLEAAASKPQQLTREGAEVQRENRKIERDQKCAELTQHMQTHKKDKSAWLDNQHIHNLEHNI